MQAPNDVARVEVTVLRVQPVGKGRLLALASVELSIDGVALTLHGLQVLQLRHPGTGEPATGVDLPRYRTPDGRWQPALELPEELHAPIGKAVLACCCELGITRREPATG
jgi:hypothetical protein